MNESISILGIPAELIPMQRNALRGLNADMLLRFGFYSITFNGQQLCLIRAKNRTEVITPTKYKKITEQVENVVGIPVGSCFIGRLADIRSA